MTIRFLYQHASARSVEPALAPRAKPLPRRLHSEPDRALEDLTSATAVQYKLQAKSRLHALLAEFSSLHGGISLRRIAEIWLGSLKKEGTIRGWKDLSDLKRYPRQEDLDRLAHLIRLKREERDSGAFK